MTDFTKEIQESGTTTGDIVGEALENAVEAAGDKVDSAVESVEESVDAVLPLDDDLSDEAPSADDADAVMDAGADAELQEHHTEIGVASHEAKQELPQLNAGTFSSQLFWLATTFILLYLLMSRSVLPRIHEVLEKRRFRIEHDLDQAERLAKESNESKADYERMHADSVARSQQMITDAEHAIRKMVDSENAKLDAELAERMAEADTAIEKATSAVKSKLKPVAEEVAQEIVKAMTGSNAADKKVAEMLAKAKW